MTIPTAPRIGMSVAFHPGAGHEMSHGGRAYPALVLAVLGSPVGDQVELLCFRPDGGAFTAWRPMSEAAWCAAGSDPNADHWSFVDLS
jgi:hypothetical protein